MSDGNLMEYDEKWDRRIILDFFRTENFPGVKNLKSDFFGSIIFYPEIFAFDIF